MLRIVRGLATAIASGMTMAQLIAADMPPPAIIFCREHKPVGAREYWSWRLIENKSCWYPGHPGRSKTTLRWREPSPGMPAGKGAGPQPEDSPPQTSEPPVRPAPDLGEFERRWQDLMQDLVTPP
jgi:hypothetical protein